MIDLFTFHKTVRGYSHVKKEIPCEDFSGSYVAEDGSYRIIAVADGHGDSACIRSEVGSKTIVNIVLERFKAFAETIISEMTLGQDNGIYQRLWVKREREELIKHLTDSMISKWYEVVNEDLKEHPLTEEDIQKSGKFTQKYQVGECLEHVYGTTVIAGLWIKDLLILIHQGDGRCDVFYGDGTVDQPIPWDPRCHDNVTTSMCDTDVTSSVRHCVIDCGKTPVIACYMGSDGVEDSYINNDDQSGTHVFYANLTCEIIKSGKEEWEEYLMEYLPIFSKQGSGDDVSVAGIVDLEAAQKFVPRFEAFGKRYEIQESLLLYQRKLDSMERKHKFLKEKMEKEKVELEIKTGQHQEFLKKFSENQVHIRKLEAALTSAEEDCKEEQQQVERMKMQFQKGGVFSGLDELKKDMENTLREFTLKKSSKQLKVKELMDKKEIGMQKISVQEKLLQSCEEELAKANIDFEKTKVEYEEYHTRYCDIEERIKYLQKEWNDLSNLIEENVESVEETTEVAKEDKILPQENDTMVVAQVTTVSEEEMPEQEVVTEDIALESETVSEEA